MRGGVRGERGWACRGEMKKAISSSMEEEKGGNRKDRHTIATFGTKLPGSLAACFLDAFAAIRRCFLDFAVTTITSACCPPEAKPPRFFSFPPSRQPDKHNPTTPLSSLPPSPSHPFPLSTHPKKPQNPPTEHIPLLPLPTLNFPLPLQQAP